MDRYIETAPNVFALWIGQPINNVQHPTNILDIWSPMDLTALGLILPAAADPVPDGKVIVSTSVQRGGDGAVKYINALADAPPPVLRVSIHAVGNFRVQDMDVSGIETAVNLSAALWMDSGSYLILFSDPLPDANYVASAYSSSGSACVSEKSAEYLMVNVVNESGPFDPSEFSVQVIRVQ